MLMTLPHSPSPPTSLFPSSTPSPYSGKDKAEIIGIPDEGEFEDNNDETPFVYSHGITQEEAARLLIVYGRNELPEKTIPKW